MKTLFLLLLSISCFGQANIKGTTCDWWQEEEKQQTIKIGDIEISEYLAKDYFLWCYQHPDTMWFLTNTESLREKERFDKELQEKLLKAKNQLDSIKIRFETILDGSQGIDRAISKKEIELAENNIGSTEKSIKQIVGDDELTYYYIGYITKHEPTAQDFSVWFLKRCKIDLDNLQPQIHK